MEPGQPKVSRPALFFVCVCFFCYSAVKNSGTVVCILNHSGLWAGGEGKDTGDKRRKNESTSLGKM